MRLFLKTVMTLIVMAGGFAIPNARGATADNPGYIFYADSKGNIEGMSETKFPESYRNGKGYVIGNLDLSGMKNPVLRVWTNEHSQPVANNLLEYAYIQTSESDAWKKLTVNKDLGCVTLPTEAISVGFSYDLSQSLSYITINDSFRHADDIVISDLDFTVVKGSIKDGEFISPDEYKTVEVILSHPDLASLTSGYGDFGWIFQGDQRVTITVSADTPLGSMLIMSNDWDWAGGSRRFSFPIPAFTSEITFKFVFQSGDSTPVKFDTIDGKLESDLCIGICEKGNDSGYMSFAKLASGQDFAWYDIDGDGVKEWAGGRNRYDDSIMRFNYDLMGEFFIEYLKVDQWKNYGKDGISAISSTGVYDWDGEAFQEALSLDGEVKVIDFNNDGRNDFLDIRNNQLISYSPIGEFSRTPVRFMTPQEYYDYVVEHKGSGLGSGMSVIGGGEGTPGSFGSFQYVDINNDGYYDFIDGASGQYLMNVGDGRFVKDSFSGRVIFRDFNGDGINDMLSYDSSSSTLSLLIQNKDGEPKKSKLIGGFKCSDRIWCKDFDGDGDIDIVVPFDAVDNNWQSYVVTFENKGDGTFKRKEYYIEGYVDFRNCSDADNDGKYEIFGYSRASASDYNSNFRLVQFRMDGLSVSTDAETLRNEKRINKEDAGILVADIDNSGKMRVILNDSIIILSETLNVRPQRMPAPKLVRDAESGDLIVSWDAGSDKETSPLDLTYELRIGTAPDKCDILWSDALPSGMRRNLLEGNCGYSRQRRFSISSWPAGKIYVSVQAVDDNGMGSEFSEYAIYDKREPAADFMIATPPHCAVTDECEVVRNSISEDGVSYEWDFDGGELQDGSDSKRIVIWQTPGLKKVTLRAVSPDGVSTVATKEVEVVPARLTGATSEAVNDAVDLDLDGKYELLNHKQFLEYDENGEYTPLKRLFNNSMTIGWQHKIVDINRDGLPDMVHSRSNGYGTYYVGQLLNAEDAYMEIIDEVVVPEYYSFGVDLDNDGLVDAKGYRNTGDYFNFVDINDDIAGSDCQYYDFDGDGLMDKVYDAGNGLVKIFRNKGDFIFEEVASLDLGKRQNGLSLGDMDGDGQMDIAWNDAWEKYVTSYSDFTYVRWGDGTVSKIQAPAGHQFFFISAVFDFDNNGCMDLMIPLEYDSNIGKRDYAIVFFNSDRTWQIVSYGTEENFSHYNSYVAYRRGDGGMGFGSTRIIGPKNTLPQAPTSVSAVQTDDAIVIEWTAPNDKETPSAALRYNISIKQKDKEGEGAYFWSPMNGGLNGVPVPTSAQLLTSTRLTLPNGVIAPGEYEVKVQAVDTQMEAGDFSEPFIMKVSEGNILSMPAETMVGQSTELKMTYGYKSSDFDFGTDAEIVKELGSTVWVKWMSEGEKTVSCGEFHKSIYVHPALDAYFRLPSEVLVGAKINLECDNLHHSEWSGLQLRDFESYMPLNKHYITFTEIDESHAEMIFRQSVTPRGIRITHTLTEPYGSDEYSVEVTTRVLKEKPSVSRIDRVLTSGACQLYWTMPSELKGLANSVRVYRESDEIGKFGLLAELPLGADSFTDLTTGSDDEARRYYISFGLPYGETESAAAHRPLELRPVVYAAEYPMLTWNAYEGKEVIRYRLLRGSSIETLDCIKELANGLTSFTDLAPLDGESVYAVEAVLNVGGQEIPVRSNARQVSYSGVDNVYDDGIESLKVAVTESGVSVRGIRASGNHKVCLQLFNSGGMQLSSIETVDSEATIPCGVLPSGVYYIVASGSGYQVAKLYVR